MNNVVIILVSLAVVAVTLGVMWWVGTWPFAEREQFANPDKNKISEFKTKLKALWKKDKTLSTGSGSSFVTDYTVLYWLLYGLYISTEEEIITKTIEHLRSIVSNLPTQVVSKLKQKYPEVNKLLALSLPEAVI